MELSSLVCEEANYMLENRATVRQTGKVFGRSKSTVHNDMRKKLPCINRSLAEDVAELLLFNSEDRARRGGLALQNKRRKEN